MPVKIVRNVRIYFQPATHTSRPLQFTGPYYNVLFTGLIILEQATVVFVGLVVVVSEVTRSIQLNRENSKDFPEIFVACVVDHAAILVISAVYEAILITFSAILDVMTLNKDLKKTSLCFFAIIWVTFIVLFIHFALEKK